MIAISRTELSMEENYNSLHTPVHVRDVIWNTAQHSIIVNNKTIALTATEYRILAPLRHGEPVKYTDLTQIVYQCSFDERVRTMIDKHVDRMRNKLRGSGIYVYCVSGYGYLLLPEIPLRPL